MITHSHSERKTMLCFWEKKVAQLEKKNELQESVPVTFLQVQGARNKLFKKTLRHKKKICNFLCFHYFFRSNHTSMGPCQGKITCSLFFLLLLAQMLIKINYIEFNFPKKCRSIFSSRMDDTSAVPRKFVKLSPWTTVGYFNHSYMFLSRRPIHWPIFASHGLVVCRFLTPTHAAAATFLDTFKDKWERGQKFNQVERFQFHYLYKKSQI